MQFQLERALEILARTPPTLDALLRGLPDAWVRHNEGADTWSPFDVVGHLIHGERTDWITRAGIILERGESRTFDPFDRLAQFKASKGKSIADLLDEFARLRAANVTALGGLALTPADLSRTGRHPDFGVVTLGQLLATWVVHDLGHIAQITRTMSKQFAGEVGPWRAYLPVLTR